LSGDQTYFTQKTLTIDGSTTNVNFYSVKSFPPTDVTLISGATAFFNAGGTVAANKTFTNNGTVTSNHEKPRDIFEVKGTAISNSTFNMYREIEINGGKMLMTGPTVLGDSNNNTHITVTASGELQLNPTGSNEAKIYSYITLSDRSNLYIGAKPS
jgi:hypothetical protein